MSLIWPHPCWHVICFASGSKSNLTKNLSELLVGGVMGAFVIFLRNMMCVLLFTFSLPVFACSDCEYESCAFGACICVPKSGCVLQVVPAPIRPPDPGKWTQALKHDPVGALVNPLGVYNPTGIPQIGDVVEFAIKNPDQVIAMLEDPGRIIYSPVAATIISARNAVIANGGRPIPDKIKSFLRRWHSQELIDSVRWTSNWGLVSNTLQAAQMTLNEDTVVFRRRLH